MWTAPILISPTLTCCTRDCAILVWETFISIVRKPFRFACRDSFHCITFRAGWQTFFRMRVSIDAGILVKWGHPAQREPGRTYCHANAKIGRSFSVFITSINPSTPCFSAFKVGVPGCIISCPDRQEAQLFLPCKAPLDELQRLELALL